jgi:YfiH family protein
MQVAPDHLATVHQVHSADVIRVDGPLPDVRPKADAMVSNTPGVALAILTADCQPVLFADHENGVIGGAHAGWRGALDGVLEATVEAMIPLGAKRENIVATIGPSISQAAYEVGADFMDEFVAMDTENTRFFATGQGDRLQFDLPSFGLHRLRSAGIKEANWTRHCTYSDAERFYSYRRTTHAKEADYGRMISVIRL